MSFHVLMDRPTDGMVDGTIIVRHHRGPNTAYLWISAKALAMDLIIVCSSMYILKSQHRIMLPHQQKRSWPQAEHSWSQPANASPQFGPVTPYCDVHLSQRWLRYWLVSDGIKPLPEPMLTNHLLGLSAFTIFKGNALDIYPWYENEYYYFNITTASPRGQGDVEIRKCLISLCISMISTLLRSYNILVRGQSCWTFRSTINHELPIWWGGWWRNKCVASPKDQGGDMLRLGFSHIDRYSSYKWITEKLLPQRSNPSVWYIVILTISDSFWDISHPTKCRSLIYITDLYYREIGHWNRIGRCLFHTVVTQDVPDMLYLFQYVKLSIVRYIYIPRIRREMGSFESAIRGWIYRVFKWICMTARSNLYHSVLLYCH